MSGGGGGSSIIAAYAVVRNLFRSGRKADQSPERAGLDAEELREVEYESMGLPVPEHRDRSRHASIWQRLVHSRLVTAFRRSG
jgi:hypothetical protein